MSEQIASREGLADEDVIAVFEDSDYEVLSTAEVATELDVRRWVVNERLPELAEDGVLEFRLVNGNLDSAYGGSENPVVTVWWLAGDGPSK